MLKLYYIDSKYLSYLSKFEKHIWHNEYNDTLRPYVGIIIEISNVKYFAPLSSFKPKKTSNYKERIDLKLVKHKKRILAYLQLNNMIPINDLLVNLLNINAQESKYKSLLLNELRYLRTNQVEIRKEALKLYNLIAFYKDKGESNSLTKRCYDFKLLEEKLKEYNN